MKTWYNDVTTAFRINRGISTCGINKSHREAVKSIASVIAKRMTPEAQAELINVCLSADADEQLTDREATDAAILFDYLMETCGETVIAKAMGS